MSRSKTGKAIDFKLLKRVLLFARPYRKILFLVITFSILLSFLSPLRPFLINYAVDNFIILKNGEKLRFISIILIAILFLESIIHFFYIYFATWLGQHVIQDIRSKV